MKWLLTHNIPFIFFPCVPYERSEFKDANNHYNCPIVTSYAENIKNNMEELKSDRFDFRNPFLSFESREIMTNRLIEELPLRSQKLQKLPGKNCARHVLTYARRGRKL